MTACIASGKEGTTAGLSSSAELPTNFQVSNDLEQAVEDLAAGATAGLSSSAELPTNFQVSNDYEQPIYGACSTSQ